MGRPALHQADAFLDAAAALMRAGGPGAVTMAGVARAAGAPSGSLYHRFPSREALLGALWLRTVERFQGPYLEHLARPDPVEGVVQAARHVVRWSRRHPGEAALLLRGAGDFGVADWPADVRERAATDRASVDRALGRAARRLGGPRRATLDRVVFAAVDAPYAAVRRHLAGPDRALPRRVEDLVETTARALLA